MRSAQRKCAIEWEGLPAGFLCSEVLESLGVSLLVVVGGLEEVPVFAMNVASLAVGGEEGASLGPPGGVVHFEVGVVASRCCALAALADDDGAALFEGGEAVGSADVEGIGVAAQKNGGHVGVARDIAQDAGDELVGVDRITQRPDDFEQFVGFTRVGHLQQPRL